MGTVWEEIAMSDIFHTRWNWSGTRLWVMLCIGLGLCLGNMVHAAEGTAGAATKALFEPIGMGGGGAMCSPAVSSYDPNLMFISTDMGPCFRSEDGGKHWEMIHFRQMHAGRDVPPLILKDAIYSQGSLIWSGPVIKVSKDKGKTWTAVADKFPWHPAGINCLQGTDTPSLVLFAGNDKGCWRSEDGGKSWTAVSPDNTAGQTCHAIVVMESRVLVALGNRLYDSHDLGKSWKNMAIDAANDKPLLSLCAGQNKATNETVLYVIAQDVGTLQSLDEGKTWRLVHPWANQNYLQMAVNQTDIAFSGRCWGGGGGENAFRTTDKGKTWSTVFPPGPGSTLDWAQIVMRWGDRLMDHGIYVAPNDTKLVMIGGMADAYVSRDAGTTWTAITTASGGELPPQPGNPLKRWTTPGAQVTGCFSIHVDPSDPRRIFAGNSDIGCIRSIDGGESWSSLMYRGQPWENSFYDVAFDPFVKDRIYAAASITHDIPTWGFLDQFRPTGGIVISDDGGNNWKKLWAHDPEEVVTGLCIDAKASKDKDHVVLYAALHDDGIYKSMDSGKTWVKKSNGLGYPGNARVFRVRVHPQTGSVFAVITGRRHNRDFPVPGGFFRSTDGGETWADLTAELKFKWPAGFFAVHPQNENIMLLSVSSGPGFDNQGGIWKTIDGGKTWKQTLTGEMVGKYCPPPYIQGWDVTFNKVDPNIVYYGAGFTGLWYSTDMGDTWKPYQEFPAMGTKEVITDPLDPKRVIVTTWGAGLWRGPYLPPREMK